MGIFSRVFGNDYHNFGNLKEGDRFSYYMMHLSMDMNFIKIDKNNARSESDGMIYPFFYNQLVKKI